MAVGWADAAMRTANGGGMGRKRTERTPDDVRRFFAQREAGDSIAVAARKAGISAALGKKWSAAARRAGSVEAVVDELTGGKRTRGKSRRRARRPAAHLDQPVEPETVDDDQADMPRDGCSIPVPVYVAGPSDQRCGECSEGECAGVCPSGQWDRFVRRFEWFRLSSAPDAAVLEAAAGGAVTRAQAEAWGAEGMRDFESGKPSRTRSPAARFYEAGRRARAIAQGRICRTESEAVDDGDERQMKAVRLARENLGKSPLRFDQSNTASLSIGAQNIVAVYGKRRQR